MVRSYHAFLAYDKSVSQNRGENASCTAWNTYLDNSEPSGVYYPGYRYAWTTVVGEGTTVYRDRPSYIVSGADTHVFCLPISRYHTHFRNDEHELDHYLLLTQVNAEVGDGNGVYKRIGLASVTREPGEFLFADWPITRFVFI